MERNFLWKLNRKNNKMIDDLKVLTSLGSYQLLNKILIFNMLINSF